MVFHNQKNVTYIHRDFSKKCISRVACFCLSFAIFLPLEARMARLHPCARQVERERERVGQQDDTQLSFRAGASQPGGGDLAERSCRREKGIIATKTSVMVAHTTPGRYQARTTSVLRAISPSTRSRSAEYASIRVHAHTHTRAH